MEIVLGLSGMELDFFLASYMVLCCGFVSKSIDNKSVFWQLLSNAFSFSQFALSPSPQLPPSKQAGGEQELGGQTARTTDMN